MHTDLFTKTNAENQNLMCNPVISSTFSMKSRQEWQFFLESALSLGLNTPVGSPSLTTGLLPLNKE